LLNFQRAWRAARQAAFEHFERQKAVGVTEPTFEAQRGRLAGAKSTALRERGQQLAGFKAAAEAAGASAPANPSTVIPMSVALIAPAPAAPR
jgi:hypothetical protein